MLRSQAHTLAQAIDWQGTLIVPVPAGASSFRQVEIRGSRGLLVASTNRRGIRAVVWSAHGSVYGITGALNDQRLPSVARDLGITPFTSMFPPSGAIVVWAIAYVVVTFVVAIRQFDRRPL